MNNNFDPTADKTPTITVICGQHKGSNTSWWQRKYKLDEISTLGRRGVDKTPDIWIPTEITTVSPMQGVFQTVNGETNYQASPYAINQLYRRGECLKPGVKHQLFDRDILALYGDSTKQEYTDVFFVYSSNTSSNSLSINIQDRSVTEGGGRKYLLRNINMNIRGGHMVLVLGGSGAGKTTFMNAVMGYEPAKGRIIYNSQDIYKNFENMKYEIGYVPQQDLLRMNDTVYDTLLDAARMRLPKRRNKNSYRDDVEQTLRMLGLKNEENKLVRKLSGGQRKRLSIAVEYIGGPSLFFLDEPDSGLDSGMAHELMSNLRSIADMGKIVIVISHSPNRVADLFDDVIVLAKHTVDNCGYLAYYGDTKGTRDFFGIQEKTDLDLEGIVWKINREEEGGDGKGDYYINKYYSERIGGK